jgi:peptide subunit release factor 1 (eRF1)
MISQKDLKDLLAFESEVTRPILSVYLNVDQSQAVNLNRGFESALKSLLQKVEQGIESETLKRSFLEDSQRVASFVGDYEPEAKSLVIFHDSSRNYLWHQSFEVELPSSVHWHHRPYIRPLLEAKDEFERYGVILTDRARARLFIVAMNAIEEIREALAEADVRKFDASGTDQILSQMSFQRKADEHARWHLRNVAERMNKLAERYKFDRLILAGTQEVVSELRNLLADRLKRSIVGTMAFPIDAGISEILEETIALQEQYERTSEMKLVQNLLTASAKNQLAVTRLNAVLEAALDGRIRQCIYSEGFSSQGSECQGCGSLFASSVERCPRCKETVLTVEDLVESLVVKVVRDGGTLEQVKGEAAGELTRHGGGVGAFLRF